MKVIKHLITWFAAIWTGLVAVGVVSNAFKHDGTRGTTELAGGIAAIAIALGITYMLFQWARGSKAAKPDDTQSNP